jgi:hypothetical protein
LMCTFVAVPHDLNHNLLRQGLKLLPNESSFPFDSSHLVVIENYADFIKAHPELQARPDLQQGGKELYAFTISQSWPIYFNFDGHEILTEAYSRAGGQWVAYLVAAVLTHEAVHARGDPRESAALSEELKLDRFFYSQKKLPLNFDLAALAEQYRAALEEERSLSARSRASVSQK